jgi:hypothetical protein
MFTTIISAFGGVYSIISLSYEYKSQILTIYSLFDTSKLIFYTVDKLGIFDIIKKKNNQNPTCVYVEIYKSETDLGEFELIDMVF